MSSTDFQKSRKWFENTQIETSTGEIDYCHCRIGEYIHTTYDFWWPQCRSAHALPSGMNVLLIKVNMEMLLSANSFRTFVTFQIPSPFTANADYASSNPNNDLGLYSFVCECTKMPKNNSNCFDRIANNFTCLHVSTKNFPFSLLLKLFVTHAKWQKKCITNEMGTVSNRGSCISYCCVGCAI